MARNSDFRRTWLQKLIPTGAARASRRPASAWRRTISGLLLSAVAVFGLNWNEARTAASALQRQEETAGVLSIATDKAEASSAGRLVYLTGELTAGQPLTDPQFGISAAAVKLRRVVEIYQWQEHPAPRQQEDASGKTQTVPGFAYSRFWSDRLIDSSGFHSPEYQNPSQKEFDDWTGIAGELRLGIYQLSPELIEQIAWYEALPLTTESLDELPEALRTRGRLHEGLLYFSEDPAKPTVGDLRIKYRIVQPRTVSLLAQRQEEQLVPYTTRNGDEIALLKPGQPTVDELVEQAFTRPVPGVRAPWLFRGVGAILLWLGVLRLEWLWRWLPAVPGVGPVFRTPRLMLTTTATVVLMLLVAGWNWFAVQALLGGGLFVVAMGLTWWLWRLGKRRL